MDFWLIKKIGNLGISCTLAHGEAGQGPEEVAEHGDGGAEGVQVAEQRRQAAVLRHAAHRVLHQYVPAKGMNVTINNECEVIFGYLVSMSKMLHAGKSARPSVVKFSDFERL